MSSVNTRKSSASDRFEVITRGRDGKTTTSGGRIKVAKAGSVFIERDDAMNCYPRWAAPTCIIVDGPYGLGKFPGEPKTPANLAEWYAPHIAAWSAHAKTDTTLWFGVPKSAGRWCIPFWKCTAGNTRNATSGTKASLTLPETAIARLFAELPS